MGSYKWGYKSPNMGYNYGYPKTEKQKTEREREREGETARGERESAGTNCSQVI